MCIEIFTILRYTLYESLLKHYLIFRRSICYSKKPSSLEMNLTNIIDCDIINIGEV